MERFSSAWNLLLLLLVLVTPLTIDAGALPDGFFIGLGSSGVELVWSSTTDQPVRMGGARYEFRMGSGELFGYPREMQGTLVLPLSRMQSDRIATNGQDLQVWVSGRRHDGDAATNTNVNLFPSVVKNSVTTPTVPVNPAARGTSSTRRITYALTGLDLGSDEFPFPLEVQGEVTLPIKLKTGVKYPLVLFMHGRHATCYRDGPNGLDSGGWPCEDGYKPIPSYQGYRYVADILASQDHVVVSIAANAINGQDDVAIDGGAEARSLLIRHHLNLWAQWNTRGGDPWSGNRFLGKLDMEKVVLVGHSRGGEGVNRAAIDASSSSPFKIVGLVSYGPTAFGRQVTPDVHSATILPTCDGDVTDLQGQAYVDSSRDIAISVALRSAVIALGCNHNYFNTEWTPGLAQAPAEDDWGDEFDAVCGSKGGGLRLTPRQQQVVGAAYTAALVKLAVKQDAAMLQLLDGSFVRPAAIGRADVAVNAVGGAAYRLLYRPEDNNSSVILSRGMTGGDCLGYTRDFGSTNGLPVCFSDDEYFESPHWLRLTYDSTYPVPHAVELRWTRAGATARFNVRSGLVNLTSRQWVDVRVANNLNQNGVHVELLVRDNIGRNATLITNLTTVEGIPGGFGLGRVHARTLRGSLASVQSSRVDLNNIVAVLLVARSSPGRVWVIDIATSRARIEQPKVLNLPVISVEKITVSEGIGFKKFKLKITADQLWESPGSIWVSRSNLYGTIHSKRIDLPARPNRTVAEIPMSFMGDSVYGTQGLEQIVTVGALRGVVTGNYRGGLFAVEDETRPYLSVEVSNVTATEGSLLEWNLRLSAPRTETDVLFFVSRPNGAELTSSDVPIEWLNPLTGWLPLSTPMPLSSLGIFLSVKFPYGAQSAKLTVPISRDFRAEGDESILLEAYEGFQGEIVTLVGMVRKHN